MLSGEVGGHGARGGGCSVLTCSQVAAVQGQGGTANMRRCSCQALHRVMMQVGHYCPAAITTVLCLQAVESVLAGRVQRAFAVVRPPGHHAECTRAMGFCFFNSAAVAALVAHRRLGAQRVLVLDWDVHHGGPPPPCTASQTALSVRFRRRQVSSNAALSDSVSASDLLPAEGWASAEQMLDQDAQHGQLRCVCVMCLRG